MSSKTVTAKTNLMWKLFIPLILYFILVVLLPKNSTANDSTKKVEEKGIAESIYSTGHLYPLDYTKKRLTGKTPKVTFLRAESLYKEAKEILKKAPIENGVYKPDGAYALFALDRGYLATLFAIDGYLLSKGLLPESLPTSVFAAYKYEAVLMKIPVKGETLVSYFWAIYNDLFIQRHEKKWEIKKTTAAFDKVKIIIETLKEEAMKEKGWEKATTTAPPIKIEECGFARTQETLFAPFESLDIKKKLLTGKTPTDAFKEADSLYKFAEELLKKNSIKNGFYQSAEYVKKASGMGYLSALRAIEAYLLSKEVPPEKLPVSTLNSEYNEAIVKIPHNGNLLTISLETAFDKLFWFGYFWGGKEDKVIKEGLSKVKFIINTLKEEAKKEKGWR